MTHLHLKYLALPPGLGRLLRQPQGHLLHQGRVLLALRLQAGCRQVAGRLQAGLGQTAGRSQADCRQQVGVRQ